MVFFNKNWTALNKWMQQVETLEYRSWFYIQMQTLFIISKESFKTKHNKTRFCCYFTQQIVPFLFENWSWLIHWLERLTNGMHLQLVHLFWMSFLQKHSSYLKKSSSSAFAYMTPRHDHIKSSLRRKRKATSLITFTKCSTCKYFEYILKWFFE